MIFKPALAAALALCAAPLFAAGTAQLTYAQFELAVPHLDLEACPASMAEDGTFCRATLRHDEIHVFSFREDGDQPMTGFQSFPADGLHALLD
ncbi:hypothetical protein DC366_00380 [Pelagivirga sediminicola]|uniref:Uncharacterized protein n=1 Tax=Pelagivirga sediminicola TaxID=2170575 RepID=A0A2T7GAM1_9RHOB|nr:hypothetical protein [Pelagivirga sediminicola]PVA11474.1 hypothetical protein DC366_00380 [Pelagivirga sediminicola]